MAFERHNTGYRATYTDAVKAWTRLKKGGAVSLYITMSGQLASKFPALDKLPAYAGVFLGTGEDAGKMRLEFAMARLVEGDVLLGGGVHGLRRLCFAAPPNVPQVSTSAEPCRIIEDDQHSLVIDLPIAAWTKASGITGAAPRTTPVIPERVPGPAPAQSGNTGTGSAPQAQRSGNTSDTPARAQPAPPPKPDPGPTSHRINAVRYLAKKGVMLTQTERGEYRMGEMIVAEAEVLRLVNEHRVTANLPRITMTDLE